MSYQNVLTVFPAKVYQKREWLINHACHFTRCVSSRIMSQILSLLKHKKHRPLDIKLFINPNSKHRHHFETIFSPSIQGICLYCCRCVIWRKEFLQQLEYYLTFKLNVVWLNDTLLQSIPFSIEPIKISSNLQFPQ